MSSPVAPRLKQQVTLLQGILTNKEAHCKWEHPQARVISCRVEGHQADEKGWAWGHNLYSIWNGLSSPLGYTSLPSLCSYSNVTVMYMRCDDRLQKLILCRDVMIVYKNQYIASYTGHRKKWIDHICKIPVAFLSFFTVCLGSTKRAYTVRSNWFNGPYM